MPNHFGRNTMVLSIATTIDHREIEAGAQRERVAPEAFLKKLLEKNSYLPLNLQRICGAGYVFHDAGSPTPPFHGAFAGDELNAIFKIWSAFTFSLAQCEKRNDKIGFDSYPTLVVADSGRFGIETLRHSTLRALLSEAEANFHGDGTDLKPLPDVFTKGLRIATDTSDKWGDKIPNYLNRFSSKIIDMREIYGVSDQLLPNAIAEFIEKGKDGMEDLAETLHLSALDIWKKFCMHMRISGKDVADEIMFPDETKKRVSFAAPNPIPSELLDVLVSCGRSEEEVPQR